MLGLTQCMGHHPNGYSLWAAYPHCLPVEPRLESVDIVGVPSLWRGSTASSNQEQQATLASRQNSLPLASHAPASVPANTPGRVEAHGAVQR